MRCDRCGTLQGKRYPRTLGSLVRYLCGACCLKEGGLAPRQSSGEYARAMAEAKQEFDAWDLVFQASRKERRRVYMKGWAR
jgi:hypothetical protein